MSATDFSTLVLKADSSGIKKADKDLDNLSKTADKTEKSTTKMAGGFSTLAKSMAAVTVAAGAMAVTFATMNIIRVAKETEMFMARLKTATGTIDSASMAFDRLNKFAATTPFTLKQSIDGFIQLKNLGLDPSEKSMTSYGNTAAAMGKSLSQMIEAVADASTLEFERLKEFGIKSSKQGDQVSFTFRGVTKTIGNSSEEIQQYLMDIGNTDFAGAMADQMDTVDGQLSNLKQSFDDLWRVIGDGIGITDILKGGLESVSGIVVSLTNELNDLFTAIDINKYADLRAEQEQISESLAMYNKLVADGLEVNEGMTLGINIQKERLAEINSLLPALRKELDLKTGVVKEEAKAVDKATVAIKKYTTASTGASSSTTKATQASIAQKRAMEETLREVEYLTNSVRTEQEIYNDDIASYANLLQSGNLPLETYLRLTEKSGNALQDATKQTKEFATETEEASHLVDEAWTDVSNGISGEFEGLFKGILSGEEDAWSNFTNNVKDMFFNMLADMAAKLLTSAVFDFLGGNFGGGVTSMFGGVASGIASLFGGGGSGDSGGALGIANNMQSVYSMGTTGMDLAGGFMSSGASVAEYGQAVYSAMSAGANAGQAAMLAAQTAEFAEGAALTAEALGAVTAEATWTSQAMGVVSNAANTLGTGIQTAVNTMQSVASTAAQTVASIAPYATIAAAYISVAMAMYASFTKEKPGMIRLKTTSDQASSGSFGDDDVSQSVLESSLGNIQIDSKHDGFKNENVFNQYKEALELRVNTLDDAIIDFVGEDVTNKIIEGMKNVNLSQTKFNSLETESFLISRFGGIAEIVGGDFAEGYSVAFNKGVQSKFDELNKVTGLDPNEYEGTLKFGTPTRSADLSAETLEKVIFSTMLFSEATEELQGAYSSLNTDLTEHLDILTYFSSATDASKQTLVDLTNGVEGMTQAWIDSVNAPIEMGDKFDIGSGDFSASDIVSTSIEGVILNFIELDTVLKTLSIETMDFTKANYELYEEFKAWAGGIDGVIEKIGQLYSINTMFESMSIAAFDLSIAGVQASDALIEAAGGLEELGNKLGGFFDAFGTTSEKAAFATQNYKANIEALNNEFGADISTNISDYKATVQALIGSSEASAELKIKLLDLTPAVQSYQSAITAGQQANARAMESSRQATQQAIKSAQDYARAIDEENQARLEAIALAEQEKGALLYKLGSTDLTEKEKLQDSMSVLSDMLSIADTSLLGLINYTNQLDMTTEANRNALPALSDLADGRIRLNEIETESAQAAAEALAQAKEAAAEIAKTEAEELRQAQEAAAVFSENMRELSFELGRETELDNMIRTITEITNEFGYMGNHADYTTKDLAGFIRTLDGMDKETLAAESSIKELAAAMMQLEDFIVSTQKTIDDILYNQELDNINALIEAEKTKAQYSNDAYDSDLERYQAAIDANKIILDYLDSLKISSLNQQSPEQQMNAAKQLFEESVLSGDAEGATQYAQEYLQFAQKFFASTKPYDDIFGNVTDQLEGMLTNPTAPTGSTPGGSSTLSTLEAERDRLLQEAADQETIDKDLELVAALNDMSIATNEGLLTIVSDNNVFLTEQQKLLVGSLEALNNATIQELADYAIAGGKTSTQLAGEFGIGYDRLITRLTDVGYTMQEIMDYDKGLSGTSDLDYDRMVQIAIDQLWSTQDLADKSGYNINDVHDYLVNTQGFTLDQIDDWNEKTKTAAESNLLELASIDQSLLLINKRSMEEAAELGYGGNYTDNQLLEAILFDHLGALHQIRDAIIDGQYEVVGYKGVGTGQIIEGEAGDSEIVRLLGLIAANTYLTGYNSVYIANATDGRTYQGNLSSAGYKQGTNFVPEDQWAFLHKGEAVIPEEYNQQLKNYGVPQKAVQDTAAIVAELKELKIELQSIKTVNAYGFKKSSDAQERQATAQEDANDMERIKNV